MSPPIRCGSRELYLPGIGVVRTTKTIDRSLDMHSFKIVERVTNSRERQFKIHINVVMVPERHVTAGVVRGVDVGGKHLAVTDYTNGRTIIHNMRHRSILREIISLRSIRTRKGKRRKRKIEKKISRLWKRANNIANDSINRNSLRRYQWS